MLNRILLGSLMRRKRRKLLSLVAVSLGVSVATAVATIALDVGDRVNRELRSFGANISVTPAADSLAVTVGSADYRPAGAGAYLAEADLASLRRIFWRHNIVAFAPFVDVPVAVQGRQTILTGTWFEKAMQVDKSDVFRTGLEALHPAWKIEGRWPHDNSSGTQPEFVVGRRLANLLGVEPGGELPFTVTGHPASRASWRVSGILETGGPEDDRIFAPLEAVQNLTGLEGKVRRLEVSALTKPEDAFARSDVTKLSPQEFDRWFCTPYVSSIAYQIQQAIPGAEAKPVFRVAETEGKILDRVAVLMGILAAAALATAALAVASMMFATVLERRTEIGLFKALGATNARVAALFILEAGVVGLAGGAAGYFAGSLLAKRLALQVFGAPTAFHWIFLPAALTLALVVTLAGSALPLGRGLKVSPAVVMRNE